MFTSIPLCDCILLYVSQCQYQHRNSCSLSLHAIGGHQQALWMLPFRHDTFLTSPLAQQLATAQCRVLACQFIMVLRSKVTGRQRDRAAGRIRSCDRTVSATGSIRSIRVGPQEHMDWMSALEVVVDRIDTLERHTRLHAQSIAQQHEAVGVVSSRMSATAHAIDAYKTFVSNCHANKDLVLTDRMGKLQAQIDSVTTVVGPTVELLESRMREL